MYVRADTGYQGYHPPWVAVTTPVNTLPGGELTEEKALNRRLSQMRVVVENTLCGTKINRIIQEPFRGRKAGCADRALLVSVGLHIFRCDQRSMAKQTQTA